jgi:hypothetical protein
MIRLPSYEWFMGQISFHGQGNIYSGSIGCDPFYGDNGKNIFRYRVWIEKNEDDGLILKAVYYFGNNCYDATCREIITEKDFDASSKGISEAQNWLIDKSNAEYKEDN